MMQFIFPLLVGLEVHAQAGNNSSTAIKTRPTTTTTLNGSTITGTASSGSKFGLDVYILNPSTSEVGGLTDTELRASAIPVSLTALPEGSNVIGHVLVDSAPMTPVTGTFWQATQPVSISSPVAVTGTFFQSAQPVTNTGTFAVQAAQSGTWTTIPSPVDTTPATQNISARDIGSATVSGANAQVFILGNATANSVASFTTDNFESVKIIASGVWTGTLSVELSYDGGSIWTTNPVHQTGNPYTTNNFTSNFIGGLNTAGTTNVRVRATTAWTGTATIKVIESVNPNSIYIANGLNIQDAVTQTNKLVIKGASTAALATDTSAVVALSPNSPIPTGSNVIGHVVADSGSTTTVTGNVAVTLASGAATIAKTEDSASADTDVGVPALAIRKTTPANLSGTDGDYEFLQVSAGRLWASTTIDTALPAGTNAIGKLAANSGVNIGTIDVATIAAGTNRIGSLRLVDSSDADLTSVRSTQTSRAVGVQELKDAGRTALSYYAVAAAAGTTGTETLITLTKSSGTGATSSGTTQTPANGKKFRIQSMSIATRGNTIATGQATTFNLRVNTGGACLVSSTPIIFSARSATAATASAWDRYYVEIPEGYEITGDGTLQFCISAAATYTANAPTWDVNIVGYEY